MSHGLKAWGQRIGAAKGSYGEEEGAFDKFTDDMVDYCANDVLVSKALYDWLIEFNVSHPNYRYTDAALHIEHNVATILARQASTGIGFDSEAAWELYGKLSQRSTEIKEFLSSEVSPTLKVKKEFTPKVSNAKLGYVKGNPIRIVEETKFNPGSNDAIANLLSSNIAYSWTPKEFTPTGKPKISEEILKSAYENIKHNDNSKAIETLENIIEYRECEKMLAQLGSGQKGWLKFVRSDGLIHGGVNVLGAATRRMTHSNPNLAQVPNADHKFGKLCRNLFVPPPPFKLIVGCDAEQLELRGLGHLLYTFDGGMYIRAAIGGRKEDKTDIHWVNAKAFGFPCLSDKDRSLGKRLFYALIYGAGDVELGSIYLGHYDEEGCRAAGRRIRNQFMRNMPSFKKLMDKIMTTYKSRGYLLDAHGLPFRLRSTHSALNAINQRLGALVMKEAQVLCDQSLRNTHKLVPGKDYEFLLTIHDEFQIGAIDETIAETIGKEAANAITEAGKKLKIRCPMAGNYMIGSSWGDTH